MNDGGPAKPSEQTLNPDGLWNQTGKLGMSVRQRYKVAAMKGLLCQMADGLTFEALGIQAKERGISVTECLVRASAQHADAQIAEDEAFEKQEKETRMKDDGGPAFPESHPDHPRPGSGMSLRDWFAGMAMQGIWANPSAFEDVEKPQAAVEFVAMTAYSQAKRMLAEREKAKAEEQPEAK